MPRILPFPSAPGPLRAAGAAAMLAALALLPLAVGGCDSDGSSSPVEPPPIDPAALKNCGEVGLALELELAFIRRCSRASDCGQVLTGTSCGCTRDLVARNGVDTRQFYAIVARGQGLSCAATEFITTCDCPFADGFACVDSTCTWNYGG